MNSVYCIDLKRKLCTEVCLNGKSTIKIAHEYHIPIKTLEKWITAFYKDPHIFEENYLSKKKQLMELKKLNAKLVKENELLKKTITLLAKRE